jgi:hypothetical protein
LKAVREKKQITYKSKPTKITADSSMETLKARRAWSEAFRALNENNFNPRILYPAKLSFKLDRAIKVFHDKHKLKQYICPPSHHYKSVFKESYTQKMKAYKTMKEQAAQNTGEEKARK